MSFLLMILVVIISLVVIYHIEYKNVTFDEQNLTLVADDTVHFWTVTVAIVAAFLLVFIEMWYADIALFCYRQPFTILLSEIFRWILYVGGLVIYANLVCIAGVRGFEVHAAKYEETLYRLQRHREFKELVKTCTLDPETWGKPEKIVDIKNARVIALARQAK